MTPALLATLQRCRAGRIPCVLATELSTGNQLLLDAAGQPIDDDTAPGALPDALPGAAARACAERRTQSVECAGGTWFLELHLPPTRLLIVGAVHIAQSLVPLATALGHAVTVVDPRARFATEARFPGATLRVAWPDEAIAAERADRQTAVVALSHDPRIDDPGLAAALRADTFYVGALGSKRSHALRLGRLRALGLDDDACGRIRGPVGLPIGAVSPAEIALSILAEIVAVERDAVLACR